MDWQMDFAVDTLHPPKNVKAEAGPSGCQQSEQLPSEAGQL